jgi:autophagy-related protein 2
MSEDGLQSQPLIFCLQMITWSPKNRITLDNEVESDDCEVTMQLVPMRCILDQRAISFIRAFFHNEYDEKDESKKWSAGLHLVPPPRFRSFCVKPWKLKVDYTPQKLDLAALREGSFVELVNISPIDGMVITLSQVRVEDVVGFGSAMGGLLGEWIHEICSTQLHKFLANARPFEPFTAVGQGVSDLIVLPFEAFKNGEDVRRAMSSGVKSLVDTVTFEALTTTSRLTQYAANKMAGAVGGNRNNMAANPLPSRPTSAPKGVRDVTGHAVESLARGLQAANYKVVIVPFREYSRNGATGAATSIIRGIPVLVVAPLTGATEALSYTLLGARNALRPDIRKEEEASRTGFSSYDP